MRSRLLCCLVVVASCKTEVYDARLATGDAVRFVRAIKGNDVVVEKNGKRARVRLVGVYSFDPNVSEKKDILALARGGVDAIAKLTKDQEVGVVLERQELDPKGRHLGFLEVGGSDVGRTMIEQGSAAAYTEYPFSREADYLATETSARSESRGMWSGPVASKRLRALRETWSSVRARSFGSPPADPLLGAVR
jgi:endonuclease YncB( thermonuclease family)